jgi:conjugal transfer/entry exclusion protein
LSALWHCPRQDHAVLTSNDLEDKSPLDPAAVQFLATQMTQVIRLVQFLATQMTAGDSTGAVSADADDRR